MHFQLRHQTFAHISRAATDRLKPHDDVARFLDRFFRPAALHRDFFIGGVSPASRLAPSVSALAANSVSLSDKNEPSASISPEPFDDGSPSSGAFASTRGASKFSSSPPLAM